MMNMTRTRICSVFVMGLVACVSCSDEDPVDGGDAGASGSGAGGAPEIGSAGDANADGGVATGGAGSPGQAGTPGAAGGACEGDAETWNAIVAAPAECESADDCCVVVNSCLAEAQIVHADDFDAAATAWPYCQDDCTDCIPPNVTVACDGGHCVGTLDLESFDAGVSHCGDTAPPGDDAAQSFSCQ